MKPALIFGLALAANAFTFKQEDNELIVAPIGRVADFPRHTGTIMFDEAIDEELFVAPTGKLADLAKKYPGMIMYDEVADDELAAIHPRDGSGHIVRSPYSRFDEQADDELFIGSLPRYVNREKVFVDDEYFGLGGLFGKPKKQKQKKQQQEQQQEQPVPAPTQETTTFFEQADDELHVRPLLRPILMPIEHGTADDELISYIPEGMRRYKMPAADDEFVSIKYPTDEFGRIVHPPYARFDEAADEELAFVLQRDRSGRIASSPHGGFDGPAGGELLHLRDLIRQANVHTFDDDEFRAEKLPHLKAQEMTHMKAHLSDNKRKFRPVVDTSLVVPDYVI